MFFLHIWRLTAFLGRTDPDFTRYYHFFLEFHRLLIYVSVNRNKITMTKLTEIAEVLAGLDEVEDVERFCREIFSPRELDDLALRWQLLKELHQGETQRAIAARHRISLCKITRGSKILKTEGSFILQLLRKREEL